MDAEIGSESVDMGSAAPEPAVDTSPVETDSGLSQESAEPAAPVEGIFELDGKQITLDEARNGYLRQADYTRKTQELADQRNELSRAQAIQQALEANPLATINAIAEAYGVNLQALEADPYADLDPEQVRISELEAKVQAQEEAAIQARISHEVAQLHQRFGEFDENALFAHAIQGNFNSLDDAYASLHFDSLVQRMAELEQAKKVEAEREQAKLDAQVVHDGHGVRGGVSEPVVERTHSLRDAYFAAKKAHGM